MSGQFQLPDGKSFPAKTRVHVGRGVAWDWQLADVSPDGRFELDGFPSGETIEVHVPDALPDLDVQSVTHSFDMEHLVPRVMGRLESDLSGLKIELITKDWKTRENESRRQIIRDRYADFIKANALSPEQEALFITAKIQEGQLWMNWRNVANPDLQVAKREAEAALEKAVRPGLGDKVYQSYREFEHLQTGQGYVRAMKQSPKEAGADWINDTETQALIRSISDHVERHYEKNPISDWEKMSLDAQLQSKKGVVAALLAAGDEALPPEKRAPLRDWVESYRSKQEEEIRQGHTGK